MDLEKQFEAVFNKPAERHFFTPGRINLIGEHIDYSGGFVFPCAITFGTYAEVSLREDRKICFYSENFKDLGIIEVSLDDIHYDEADDWANYPKGVLKMIQDAGHKMNQGLDILFYGNIPNGAGLSSSASLEVLMGLIASKVNQLELDMVEIVKLSQKAENEFVGVNCGIMDQFAVGMGQENKAILLNTNTLDYTYVPVDLGDHSIVIMNTNKRRGLVDSAYNERRSQCEQALTILQGVKTQPYLCDYTLEDLVAHKNLFKDELVYKRAHHAITENQRTIQAAEVLKSNDLKTFGQLMNQSHISLRDDYEVTGPELDAIVASAWKQEGIIGARVTGAGFGGCALAIVHNDHVDDFIENVGQDYLKDIGYEASFYVALVGQGAHETFN